MSKYRIFALAQYQKTGLKKTNYLQKLLKTVWCIMLGNDAHKEGWDHSASVYVSILIKIPSPKPAYNGINSNIMSR